MSPIRLRPPESGSRYLRNWPAIVLLLVLICGTTGGSLGDAVAAGTPVTSPQPKPTASVRYRAPISTPIRVVNPFSPPLRRYGPGHVGVDLAVEPGATVVAAAGGIVRFAGAVAGRGVIVVRHDDGLATEYEPVSAQVRAGMRVTAGQPLGRLQTTMHRRCTTACLHWGANRDGEYLDPLSLLAPLGVVRLDPLRGNSL